jgi:hypothetical protein
MLTVIKMIGPLAVLREEDIPQVQKVVSIFKKHGFGVGVHGTSLWNRKYKDIDLLVFSKDASTNPETYKKVIQELQSEHDAKILEQKGSAELGWDHELNLAETILHISYCLDLSVFPITNK